jgi:hypothetical protein
MTKLVRIQNADTNDSVRVVVETYDCQEFKDSKPVTDSTYRKSGETEVACGDTRDFYIHLGSYVVVKELER